MHSLHMPHSMHVTFIALLLFHLAVGRPSEGAIDRAGLFYDGDLVDLHAGLPSERGPASGIHSRRAIPQPRSGVNYTWDSWAHGPGCPDQSLRLVPYAELVSTDNLDRAVKETELLATAFVNGWQDQFNATVGVTMIIVYDNHVLACTGFGQTSMRNETAPGCSTIVRIGSITKIFTSIMLMQAIEQGAVALDDPLTKFFSDDNPPKFAPRNPYGATLDGVTLHSLAQHTAGIAREVPYGLYSNENVDEYFAFLNRTPLLFPPYTQPHYSNLGVALLGRALERAVNTTYEDWVEQRILAPIGMKQSGFSFPPDVVKQMMGSALLEQGQVPAIPYMALPLHWPSPCGGLRSSMNDLGVFMRHIFQADVGRTDASRKQQQAPRDFGADEKVLSAESWNRYILPGFNLPDGLSAFGLSTFEQAYANGYWTQTKGGLLGGYGSSIAFIPELKLGVAAAVNLNTGTIDEVTAGALYSLVPALLKDLSNSRQPYRSPPNIEEWFGSYADGRVTIAAAPEGSPAAEQGYLVGSILTMARLWFRWDEAQSTEDVIALRYWPAVSPYYSCISLDEIGAGAVVYLQSAGPLRLVDVPDLSMWLLYQDD